MQSSSGSIAGGPSKLAEAKYGVVPGKEGVDGLEATEPAKDEGPRKPLEKRRAPLKRQ